MARRLPGGAPGAGRGPAPLAAVGYNPAMIFLTCFAALMMSLVGFPALADSLSQFSDEFWKWRSYEQPFTVDDIPRIERPKDLVIDWSAATVAKRRSELTSFEERWKKLAPGDAQDIHHEVDYRLMGSALARVRWEIDIEQSWRRNPLFYVDQSLGSVYVLLLPPPPFSAERQQQILNRMNSIPATLAAGQQNLTDTRQPFARLTIEALRDVEKRCTEMSTALEPQLSPDKRSEFRSSTKRAAQALKEYSEWVEKQLSSMRKDTAIGRDNYVYFLRNIAVMPFSPEQLLGMSQQEWSRALAFEEYEQGRNAAVPPLKPFPDQATQIKREQVEEENIRQFLVKQKILSVPEWLKHYRNLPLPAYVEPFSDLGVTDDLTSASRLTENGTSYIEPPSSKLLYFALATAHDPRPIIVHEGVPGHYSQLCLSWANPDPIRRHYYDSGANEGLGFYAEEMMLQAGLFDDSPHTREIIYSFMRLRALRVEVDVKLALGQFTLEQAADYLSKTVPMDAATAFSEASLFASTPGQAISYQIGKIQILELLARARRQEGEHFSLLQFHDSLWTNGNVPIALQSWEMLGDASAVPEYVRKPGAE
jgi:uncharacterized protein (DUF885 family)